MHVDTCIDFENAKGGAMDLWGDENESLPPPTSLHETLLIMISHNKNIICSFQMVATLIEVVTMCSCILYACMPVRDCT